MNTIDDSDSVVRLKGEQYQRLTFDGVLSDVRLTFCPVNNQNKSKSRMFLEALSIIQQDQYFSFTWLMTHQEIEYDRHATFKSITQLHKPVLQVKEMKRYIQGQNKQT